MRKNIKIVLYFNEVRKIFCKMTKNNIIEDLPDTREPLMKQNKAMILRAIIFVGWVPTFVR